MAIVDTGNDRDRAPSRLRTWLNNDRVLIVVAWAVATALLLVWLPPLAQPLTTIAAVGAAIVARDRVLTVFFGILAVGLIVVVILFRT